MTNSDRLARIRARGDQVRANLMHRLDNDPDFINADHAITNDVPFREFSPGMMQAVRALACFACGELHMAHAEREAAAMSDPL